MIAHPSAERKRKVAENRLRVSPPKTWLRTGWKRHNFQNAFLAKIALWKLWRVLFGEHGEVHGGKPKLPPGIRCCYPRGFDLLTPGVCTLYPRGYALVPPGVAPRTPRGLHLVPPGVSAAGARRQTHGPLNPVHYRPPKTASLTQKRVWAKNNSAIIARLEADCEIFLRKGLFSGMFFAGFTKSWWLILSRQV